jgi:citrate synthase
MSDTKPTGLEGVIAGDTAICSIDQGALIYRGYEIADLAEHATFEEVAFLLLQGHKPSAHELRYFKDELIANRALPPQALDTLRLCAPLLKQGTAVPMDVLRTVLSVIGNTDRDAQDNSPAANLAKAKRITAKIPTIIGHMQNLIDGRELIGPDTGGDANLSHAGNLLYMMTGRRPTPEAERVVDVSLILYAEHDYNASTFTARVIAGTLSDMHGALTGAVAALKGPLHGGANEAAMVMLQEIMDHTAAGGSVQSFMDRAFAEKRKLMGFGHRVYKNGDHRAPILHALGKAVARQRGVEFIRLFDIGEQVQRIMLEQKNIHPNVDFPCGMTYYTLDIPVPQYTPIFVASRVTGWAAHVMEQHANNRLIRPLSTYTGPALTRWNHK